MDMANAAAARAKGSYQTLFFTKAVTPGAVSFSQGTQGPTLQQSQSSTASQLADEGEQIHYLKHPPWTPFMTRIPKAARAICAIALLNILFSIVADPNNMESWDNLLSFAPTILAKPARGGATRNLANIVLKRRAVAAISQHHNAFKYGQSEIQLVKTRNLISSMLS